MKSLAIATLLSSALQGGNARLELRSQFAADDKMLFVPAEFADGTFVTGSDDTHLYFLEPTGLIKEQVDCAEVVRGGATPFAGGEKVAVPCGETVSVYTSAGQRLAAYPLRARSDTPPAVSADRYLVTGDRNGKIHHIDMVGGQHQVIETGMPTGLFLEMNEALPLDAGVFVVSTYDPGQGKILFVASDGKVLKEIATGPFVGKAVRAGNGDVLIATIRADVEKGAVLRLDSRGEILASYPIFSVISPAILKSGQMIFLHPTSEVMGVVIWTDEKGTVLRRIELEAAMLPSSATVIELANGNILITTYNSWQLFDSEGKHLKDLAGPSHEREVRVVGDHFILNAGTNFFSYALAEW